MEELREFECNLHLMIKNVVFKKVNNSFQTQLLNYVKKIKETDKMFVPADKSRNIYLLSKDEYQKLLTENITKAYKMTNRNKVYDINNEAKSIAKQLSNDDRIERMYENKPYITIKDHKEHFPNKISFRLINPSKSDIEKISKTILDKIITKIVSLSNVNQWESSTSVIKLYKTIPNKNQYRFIIFNIENFYPSISLELFNEALNFAKALTDINETDVSIMMQARKTLLLMIASLGCKSLVKKILMYQWGALMEVRFVN